MQRREIALGIAAAVIVAGGLVLLTRSPSDEVPLVTPSSEPLTIAVGDEPAPRAAASAPVQNAEAAAAKIRELEAMSETYRNTTFVIAIRDAGYTCDELLRVYGGFEESGKWTATCSQMLAYSLGVAGNGALRVEPMNVYWDGVARPVIQQFNEPVQPLRDSIPVVPPPER